MYRVDGLHDPIAVLTHAWCAHDDSRYCYLADTLNSGNLKKGRFETRSSTKSLCSFPLYPLVPFNVSVVLPSISLVYCHSRRTPRFHARSRFVSSEVCWRNSPRPLRRKARISERSIKFSVYFTKVIFFSFHFAGFQWTFIGLTAIMGLAFFCQKVLHPMAVSMAAVVALA